MSHCVTVKPAAGRSGELRQCEKHSKKKKTLAGGHSWLYTSTFQSLKNMEEKKNHQKNVSGDNSFTYLFPPQIRENDS